MLLIIVLNIFILIFWLTDVNMGSIFFISELFWKYSYIMKIIFIIGNIHNIYCIIKFSLTIYFFVCNYLQTKDKLKMPLDLPAVTRLQWLDYCRRIASKTEDKGQFCRQNYIWETYWYILLYFVSIVLLYIYYIYKLRYFT